MRTRIKFCGITRVEDAQHAAACGADAIGLVFAPGTPRCVDIRTAEAITAALPPWLHSVLLFRNAPSDQVRDVLARLPRAMLQFHGEEPPDEAASFGRPWLKAVPMGSLSDAEVQPFLRAFADAGCSGFVFDSHRGGGLGGSGQRFAWSRFPDQAPRAAILAGGLTPDTVQEAVRLTAPYGVDVSSGVESAPGLKDHAKMRRFADEVYRANT